MVEQQQHHQQRPGLRLRLGWGCPKVLTSDDVGRKHAARNQAGGEESDESTGESDAQQQQQQRQLNPSYQKRQQGDSKPQPKPHALGNRLNAWWSVGVPLWGM